MTVHSARNNGEKSGKRMPPVEHQFKPGIQVDPRARGTSSARHSSRICTSPGKSTEWRRSRQRSRTSPAAFLKVIAKVMPKDMNLHVNPYDHMTDEQIMERLRVIEEQTGPLLLGA